MMRERVRAALPVMLEHEGIWQGTYRHMDLAGNTLDLHRARVECVFPEQGPYAYVQRNLFTWEDGREQRSELHATLVDGRLHWDTDTFTGHAWQSAEGVLLLRLDRKDQPGASYLELIALAPDRDHRIRTWHWFRDDRPWRLTLCHERRVQGA